MRVMVIVKANKDSEAGVLPSREILSEMGKFNEELVKAGVMLAGEGLHSSAKGVRVKFGGGKSRVIDGPFTETKELIAGFWLWQVKSMEEAIEWIRRSPFQKSNEEIEIRRVFEAEDFGANLAPELKAQEESQRALHARVDFGGQYLLGCDAPADRYQAPQGFAVMAALEKPADAERVFKALAESGTISMPFQETFWAHGFGMCTDRFGTPWMVNCAK